MLFLLLLLATPQQLVKAGDAASHALRDFERIERQHLLKRDAWPTEAQAREIHAKLDIAHEAIRDSLALGMDLTASGMGAQAISLQRAQQGALRALSALTVDAPKDAQQAMARVQQAFAKLFALFPTVPKDDEHPPTRPKP